MQSRTKETAPSAGETPPSSCLSVTRSHVMSVMRSYLVHVGASSLSDDVSEAASHLIVTQLMSELHAANIHVKLNMNRFNAVCVCLSGTS